LYSSLARLFERAENGEPSRIATTAASRFPFEPPRHDTCDRAPQICRQTTTTPHGPALLAWLLVVAVRLRWWLLGTIV